MTLMLTICSTHTTKSQNNNRFAHIPLLPAVGPLPVTESGTLPNSLHTQRLEDVRVRFISSINSCRTFYIYKSVTVERKRMKRKPPLMAI